MQKSKKETIYTEKKIKKNLQKKKTEKGGYSLYETLRNRDKSREGGKIYWNGGVVVGSQ